MTKPMIEAAARAIADTEGEYDKGTLAEWITGWEIEQAAQAAITAIEPMIRAQVEREIVEWLRRRPVPIIDDVGAAIEAGVYRWTAEGVPFPKQGEYRK